MNNIIVKFFLDNFRKKNLHSYLLNSKLPDPIKNFLVLINNNYNIPEDWMNNKILKLENYIGDIPELSLKISQIRTWTYISNHHSWLKDPLYWRY